MGGIMVTQYADFFMAKLISDLLSPQQTFGLLLLHCRYLKLMVGWLPLGYSFTEIHFPDSISQIQKKQISDIIVLEVNWLQHTSHRTVSTPNMSIVYSSAIRYNCICSISTDRDKDLGDLEKTGLPSKNNRKLKKDSSTCRKTFLQHWPQYHKHKSIGIKMKNLRDGRLWKYKLMRTSDTLRPDLNQRTITFSYSICINSSYNIMLQLRIPFLILMILLYITCLIHITILSSFCV